MSEQQPDYYNRPKDLEAAVVLLTACLFGVTIVTKAAYGSLKSAFQPQIQVMNVIGGPEPEKFYEVDGKRVYLEIDGTNVEQLAQSGYSRR